MKKKILMTSIAFVVAALVAFNISIIFEKENNYNLLLENIEAKAWGETGFDMTEIKTYNCEDGRGTESVCEFTTNTLTCDRNEQKFCDTGNGTGEGGTENDTCEEYGHHWSGSTCARCGISDPYGGLCQGSYGHNWRYNSIFGEYICDVCKKIMR